jgi:hypothetical protein
MVRGRPANRPAVTSVAAGLMLGAAALTGCATHSAANTPHPGGEPPPIPLAAGMSVPGLSWATVRTGGPSVGGNFWQLLVQDRTGGRWRLATPPGVADNAGLAVTRADDGTITVGFVPSQLLRFTPLAVTSDAGARWSQGLLSAALVDGPDSLTAVPGGGRLVAITTKSVRESSSGTTGWASLATVRALAATQAGRRCGLAGLSGAVAEPDGKVLVAGGCRQPGAIGLFAATPSGWRQAGPALPGSLGIRSASIAGLISTKAGTGALVAGHTGHGEVLIPAWLAAGSSSWRTYFPMSYRVGGVASVSVSAQGVWAVVLSGRHGLVTQPPGPSGRYHSLAHQVSLPSDDATLVPGTASGELTALVPGLDTVTVWELTASGGWRRSQVISVPSTPSGQSH